MGSTCMYFTCVLCSLVWSLEELPSWVHVMRCQLLFLEADEIFYFSTNCSTVKVWTRCHSHAAGAIFYW